MAPFSLFKLTSCHNKQSQPTKPKIVGPESSKINLVHFSNVDSTTCKGFSYEGIDNPLKIVVQNTFSQGFAVFKTSITNINFVNKTFDVVLLAYDAQPQQLNGFLSFYYNDQLIDDAPLNEFTLNISPTPVVGDQFDKVKTIQLDKNGDGECTFEGFTIDKAPDLKELLKYKVAFIQAGAQITTELVFIDDHNFNLHVKLKSATSGVLESAISFQYMNHNLDITGSNTLTLNLLEDPQIVAPAQENYALKTTNTNGEIIIPHFNFSTVTQDNLEVKIKSNDDLQQLSASVVNWQESDHSFDIKVNTEYKKFINFSFTLSFINATTQEPIEYVGHPFYITTTSVVPRDFLEIKVDRSTQPQVVSLYGFKSGVLKEIKSLCYNTITIPNDITIIKENAFGEINQTSLHNLVFAPNSSLLTIDRFAFAYFETLECDLTIPYSVIKIDYGAFIGCKNLKSLTFSNATQPITISACAFQDCTNMKGDLKLPNNAIIGDGGQVFDGCGFDGTLFFPANFNKSGEEVKDSFTNLCYIKDIDITHYVRVPQWMGDDKSANFSNMGSSVDQSITKHVYYRKNALTTDDLDAIKSFFSKNSLPADFVFTPK